MSVIIKGIELPKTCTDCPLEHCVDRKFDKRGNIHTCPLIYNGSTDEVRMLQRRKDCPLMQYHEEKVIEVPKEDEPQPTAMKFLQAPAAAPKGKTANITTIENQFAFMRKQGTSGPITLSFDLTDDEAFYLKEHGYEVSHRKGGIFKSALCEVTQRGKKE